MPEPRPAPSLTPLAAGHRHAEVSMALASIHHHWTDGSSVEMEAAIEVDYPDALAECVARVRDLYRECVPDSEDSETE